MGHSTLQQSQPKIAIVTPMRDEVENIDRLFKAINAQTLQIDTWVICENGSTDGTIDLLNSYKEFCNVRNLIIKHLIDEDTQYALGFKYSRIVNHGFETVTLNSEFDFIGILDADCFPEPEYYLKLCQEFKEHPRTGILSGTLIGLDGIKHPGATDFPRGNCRLWRADCFRQAGYVIGMSADALSAAKAMALGWTCKSLTSASVTTRKVGARGGQRYYGEAAHYRSETFLYSFIRSIMIARSRPADGLSYFLGYASAYLKRSPQTSDPDIVAYSRSKMSRQIQILLKKKNDKL